MNEAEEAPGGRFSATASRLAPALALLAFGCAGSQSALDPAGPQSGRILGLWWLYLGICTAVCLAVMTLVLLAVFRRGQRRRATLILAPPAGRERRLTRAVIFGTALTTVALFVMLAGDFVTGRAIHALDEHNPLTIRVTGHQWWWEVRYEDRLTPSNVFTTANEIHIPVGQTVRLELYSSDVIHSFWVPNLHGKRDLIPGHPATATLRADREGVFRGQCAEFCGYQHAAMRLLVVAEPPEDFRRWLAEQRRPAAEPSSESGRRGRAAFLGSTCVMCHTIRGTEAASRVGPDLTHVGGRRILAGILPNTRGHLAGWIVDPQRIKPGVRMPLNVVRPADLDALVDYLSGLK